MRIANPVEAFQLADAHFLRHHTERTRIDVPASGGHRHIARAFAQFLHERARTCRVVFNILVQFLQIGPGFVPALDRVLRITITQKIGKPHQEGAPRTGIGRASIDELVRVFLRPGQQFFSGLGRCLHLVGVIFKKGARWIIGNHNALALRHFLHTPCWFKIDILKLRQAVIRQRDDVGPYVIGKSGGKRIRPDDHHVYVNSVGALLRLDFPRQFRRRCLVEGEARNQRFLLGCEIVEDRLGQGQIASGINDVERYWRRRQFRRLCPYAFRQHDTHAGRNPGPRHECTT